MPYFQYHNVIHIHTLEYKYIFDRPISSTLLGPLTKQEQNFCASKFFDNTVKSINDSSSVLDTRFYEAYWCSGKMLLALSRFTIDEDHGFENRVVHVGQVLPSWYTIYMVHRLRRSSVSWTRAKPKFNIYECFFRCYKYNVCSHNSFFLKFPSLDLFATNTHT